MPRFITSDSTLVESVGCSNNNHMVTEKKSHSEGVGTALACSPCLVCVISLAIFSYRQWLVKVLERLLKYII